jgi:penicillin-binding protein 1A
MGCAAVKENGLIKKLFTNTDKPKPMEFETVVPKTEKKEGLFSRIGNLFKKKH